MRVLSFYKPATPTSGAPDPKHMEKMGKFAQAMTEKGHLIAAGGLLAAPATSVTLKNGDFGVRDNAAPLIPEGFHGFGIIQASSDEEMTNLIRAFLQAAGDGECRLHPLMEGPAQPQ
jgi:hypothetical protein